MAITKDEVLTALKDCYDPEIPVNIVDLGLIYEVSRQARGCRGCVGEKTLRLR